MLSREDTDRLSDVAWTLVKQFAQQDRQIPAEANRGALMIADHLRAAGLPVALHQPDLYLSLPKTASVQLDNGVTYRAKPPAFTADCPEGVEGALIYLPDAGGGTPLNRSPAGVSALRAARGKIAVIEGFALPNFIAGLEAAGALGAIVVNPGVDIHWGTVSTIWGTPTLADLDRLPQIPSVAVNQPDGQALIALARSGGRARIHTSLETGWFPQYLPVVKIPGQDSDDFILLHGHYDSWREGVGDNGTGNACMLAVAMALWERRDSLRRGVRIAWWPGHSTGRYGGSTWYADTFARDLDQHCVAHLNCDSPGCRWATSYAEIACTGEAAAFAAQNVKEVTGQVARGKRPQRNSDYAFSNIGVTGVLNASSQIPPDVLAQKGYYVVGGCGGNIAWHTENDTLEIADREVLQTDIDLYFSAVFALATSDRLPFDWSAVVADYCATIARYQQGCAFDLGPSARAASALQHAIGAFYAAAPTADVHDAATKALARILIPIDFTRGPRFTHDPALNVPPLPTIADALLWAETPADQLGFLRAQLMRGQNRLVDALERAAAVVAV